MGMLKCSIHLVQETAVECLPCAQGDGSEQGSHWPICANEKRIPFLQVGTAPFPGAKAPVSEVWLRFGFFLSPSERSCTKHNLPGTCLPRFLDSGAAKRGPCDVLRVSREHSYPSLGAGEWVSESPAY